MSKLNTLSTLARLSGGRWSQAVWVSILPALILMGFGLVLAIKYGYLLVLSLVITSSVAVVYLILYIARVFSAKPNTVSSQPLNTGEDLVSAAADWSKQELEIWQAVKLYSRDLLAKQSDWSEMDQNMLLVFDFIATQYHKKSLDFSIAEGLKLIEEISRRYRLVLKEHIPVVEYLKISQLKSGYDIYDKYGDFGPVLLSVLKSVNYAKNLVVNPAKALSDFVSQQFSANMTKGVIDEMQLKAKQALLDEVAAVAINLYSTRFRIEDQDIKASTTLETDKAFLAPTLEPIRIAIVGQVGAGKSSLTNLLQGEFAVEVGALATTSGVTVCETQFGEAAIKLIDLPGLDGQESTEQLIFSEFLKSDLVLWLVKANQPARQLDKQFRQKIKQYYAQAKNISRKEPTIICVVNQVDMLNPLQDWQPPYDLNDMHNAKSKIISQALAYNHELLTPDFTVALSIADNKPHFGVEDLKLLLDEQLINAYNVQLNRNRKQAIQKRVSITEQARRIGKSGKVLAQGAFTHLKQKYRNPPQ